MKAKLISVSKPVVDDLNNLKDLITYCARVSNPSNQMNTATTDKLIAYLLKYKHFSPFEMANCVVEVEAPRDIARQLLRHRSFSFQEFSQRYADVTQLDNSFVLREARLQDNKNRQNSVKLSNDQIQLNNWWEDKQREILSLVSKAYSEALDKGIAKECARVILPEGLTMSRLYVNGTIRSWIHYIEVRTEEGVTQLEHVELARLIAEQISKAFPVEQFVK
ncbi:MAG TPA: FAD-dependent thymidylate synthase [Methanofastidiosum sp.]|nr:FAD-dependent thymidylate synthase [Methanofastidiosum sp.]